MKQTQTDWENHYQRGETPWEKEKPHPALVDFLTERGSPAGEIIVPGCGLGHDVRALSTPANRVVGIDLAPSAIAQANSSSKVGNEEYLLADLFAMPADFSGAFDVVFEHTCFCAIDPALRRQYVEAIVRLLRPSGRLIAIFFLNPDHQEEGPPYGVTGAELDRLFGPHFALEDEWVPRRTHPGREKWELLRVARRRTSVSPKPIR